MSTQQPTADKAHIVHRLERFITQRPRLERGNYGDAASYRADSRRIAVDRQDALVLLRYVAIRPGITAEAIADGIGSAYAGRLQWTGSDWEYTTGQYWPTEYRRAACWGLASVIWRWLRDGCGCDTVDKVRAAAMRELPTWVVKRWFN